MIDKKSCFITQSFSIVSALTKWLAKTFQNIITRRNNYANSNFWKNFKNINTNDGKGYQYSEIHISTMTHVSNTVCNIANSNYSAPSIITSFDCHWCCITQFIVVFTTTPTRKFAGSLYNSKQEEIYIYCVIY